MGKQQQLWKQVYESRQQNEAQRRQMQRTEKEGCILAIDGAFDHWKEVIPNVRAKIKDVVQPLGTIAELPRPLESYHVVAIGCPGDGSSRAVLDTILGYLKRGGTVVTTDWCLGRFLAPADGWLGPSLVEHTGSTGAETVPVQLVVKDHALLEGLGSLGRWQLDGGSHVCKVNDERKIEVLIESDEMRASYGSGVVLFVTRVGEGRLVHFVSHAYAQPDDMQGAQAAAMILANVFDLAVAAGNSGEIMPDAGGWFRLVIGDERLTIRSDSASEHRCIDRATMKWLARNVADADGNRIYKYINRDVPLAEFEWRKGTGWHVRVPEGSKNSLMIGESTLSSEWASLPMNCDLLIYSTDRKSAVPGITMRIVDS